MAETFSSGNISTTTPQNNSIMRASMCAVDSTGRIWVSFQTADERYIRVRYSDDSGSTWSNTIDAYDFGATGNTAISFCMGIGPTDVPWIAIHDEDNTGTFNAIYTRYYNGNDSSPAFTTFGNDTGLSTGASANRQNFLCFGGDGYVYTAFASGGSSTAGTARVRSSNDGTTWSQIASMTDTSSGSPAIKNRNYGNCIAVNSDGTEMCHFTTIQDADAGGKTLDLWFQRIDITDGSSVTVTETVEFNWPNFQWNSNDDTPSEYKCQYIDDDTIAFIWVGPPSDGGTTNTYVCTYTISTTTLSTPVAVGYQGSESCVMSSLITQGTTWWVLGVSQGTGTNSSVWRPALWKSTDSGATWSFDGLIDDTAVDKWISPVHNPYDLQSHNTSHLTQGIAFVAYWSDESKAVYWETSSPSSAPAWDAISTGTYNLNVTSAINASQDVELPDSETDLGSFWKTPEQGGRCILRSGTGTEWMAVQSEAGGGLQTFARASGSSKTSWTTTNVDVLNSYDAVAMNLDENNRPWFVAHKVGASNVKVFAWNGSAYVQNASINTNNGTIGSMECWYDGTLYHMVYPHKKSGGKWRLLHRTSTKIDDTTSRWSSPTEVWLTDNTTNADSMREGNRIAGMLDGNNDYHLIVSAKDSSSYRIKKFTYDESAGTWDSGSDLTTSSTVHFDGLTLAVDINDYVHLCYRANEVLWYQTNTSGSYVTSAPGLVSGRSSEKVAYPSIGFRRSGTQPSIAIQQEDDIVGEWSYDGTGWSWLGIFTNDRAYTDTALHHSYWRTSNYRRPTFGIAFALRGSLIYVGSSYIQWDDESEPSETEVEFSTAIKLKGFAYPEEGASFSQSNTVVHERDKALINAFSMGQSINDPAREFYPSNIEDDSDAAFSQLIGLQFVDASAFDPIWRNPFHALNFEQTIVLEKRQNLGSTDDLSFSQSISLQISKTINGDVDFDQEIGLVKFLTKSIANTFNVSQVILKTGEWNRSVTHTVTFGAEGLSIRDWNAYDPDLAISDWPTYEDSVLQVVFQWPATLPTESVTFMRPNFGDQRIDTRRSGSVRRNRSGRARTYAVPVYSTFALEWRGIPRHVGENWRQHMIKWLGSTIRYQDHNGIWHECIVTDTDLIRTQNGPEHNTFRINLQKTQRVDLSPSTAG